MPGISITAHFLFGVRTVVLLTDFIEALERRRIISAALAGRAAIETAAAAAYLSEKVTEALKRGSDSSHEQLIIEFKRALFGSRFPWADVLENENSFDAVPESFKRGKQKDLHKDVEAANVLTMMKYLERRCDERFGPQMSAQLVYEQMSEFCHPGVGTAVALLRRGELAGPTRVVLENGDRATGLFWCMMGAFVAPICETGLLAITDILERVGAEARS